MAQREQDLAWSPHGRRMASPAQGPLYHPTDILVAVTYLSSHIVSRALIHEITSTYLPNWQHLFIYVCVYVNPSTGLLYIYPIQLHLVRFGYGSKLLQSPSSRLCPMEHSDPLALCCQETSGYLFTPSWRQRMKLGPTGVHTHSPAATTSSSSSPAAQPRPGPCERWANILWTVTSPAPDPSDAIAILAMSLHAVQGRLR